MARVNFEKSLYVGCALTHAPEEFIDEVDIVKSTLRAARINVLDFVGLEAGTDVDVYEWDIEQCVAKCSAFLGIYGYPGDGIGFETRVALERDIPILGVAEEGAKVSRLITGAYKKHNRPFQRVHNIKAEVPQLIIRQFIDLQHVL